jgi:hypothetical protein
VRRREFLQTAVLGGTAFTIGAAGWARVFGGTAAAVDSPYGPLLAPDANGLALPAGFSSRVVATTGQIVSGTAYLWHTAPDGGATFPTADGGWIYTSNSEALTGGASMARFSASGQIVEARRILAGTSTNCAGGPTPWGTWLSCEEHALGRVWECDPTGVAPATPRTAMGRFQHEAAAVDPVRKVVYLTEDQSDGGLYRFVPATWPSLDAGTLYVLTETAGVLGWAVVPDPDGSPTPCRDQVPTMKAFSGGEGAWFDDGLLYFTTKGDNRVWTYDADANALAVLYDDNASPTPVLTGVDNVTVAPSGDVFVAEDGGNMELVLLSPEGAVAPFLRLTVSGSELTGPAFSPDGSRLYFSSQRNPGRTYEVSGPFRTTGGGTTTTTTTITTTTTTTSTSTSTTTTAPPGPITLSATLRRSGRKAFVDLTWTGATTPQVEVRRNGAVISTTPNDGAHTDNLNKKQGTFRYRVSHPGGSPISNEVTVTA